MNAISYYVQTIEHEDSTKTILHITITSKKATDMPDFYHFNKSQREALEEVLKPEYAQMLAELVGTYGGEVTLDEAQIRAMLAAMPKDISERRRAVVEKAYSLLGKVNYFWGGKSSAIGWDSRWGNAHSRHCRRKQNDRNRSPLRTGLFRFCRLGIQQFTGLCDWAWRRRSQSA